MTLLWIDMRGVVNSFGRIHRETVTVRRLVFLVGFLFLEAGIATAWNRNSSGGRRWYADRYCRIHSFIGCLDFTCAW